MANNPSLSYGQLEIKTPYSIRLGVVGAGAMGSGIALAALYSGMLVTVYDISPEMLDNTRGYVKKHLERKNKSNALNNLTLTGELNDLRTAGVVVEAVPEDLSLKQKIFAQLDEICPSPAILATNTSTLAVTAIAAAARTPERVAGMHFFNPAPVLPLVEVVQAARTDPAVIQTLVDLAKLMGKTPVVARDTPGFIVNRVARPFYGEALRLAGEGTAQPEEIDRLVRMAGGFRMGPFQLMDLIGIDVNYAAMQSMHEQTFGEPRYRPHRIQAQMVQQGALGRKTGHGFYMYNGNESGGEELPTPPRPERRSGRILFSPGSWAPGVVESFKEAGYSLQEVSGVFGSVNSYPFPAGAKHASAVAGITRAGGSEEIQRHILQMERELPPGAPLFCQCADTTVTEIATWVRHPERLVGFDGLFWQGGRIAALVASPTLSPKVRQQVETMVKALGYLSLWLEDSPALILPRIVCMLANEGAFAVGDDVANMNTIDLAMRLGANYPKGPLAWAKEIGYAQTIGVLEHLYREYGEERYRVAPLLRRWERLERVSA